MALTAGPDQVPEVGPGAHPPGQLVAHGLIHEIPRVDEILEGFGAHQLLLVRVDLDAHVSRLGQERAWKTRIGRVIRLQEEEKKKERKS